MRFMIVYFPSFFKKYSNYIEGVSIVLARFVAIWAKEVLKYFTISPS